MVVKCCWLADELVVAVDFILKCSPFSARSTVVHEVVWAVFMRFAKSVARPVIVGDYISERDVVLVHEIGSELGSAFHC